MKNTTDRHKYHFKILHIAVSVKKKSTDNFLFFTLDIQPIVMHNTTFCMPFLNAFRHISTEYRRGRTVNLGTTHRQALSDFIKEPVSAGGLREELQRAAELLRL